MIATCISKGKIKNLIEGKKYKVGFWIINDIKNQKPKI